MDDEQRYILEIGAHFMYRYEIKSVLGSGSFGQVVKAYDHKQKEMIALKVLRNRPEFYKQGLVEVSFFSLSPRSNYSIK
jgi:serine/threonine protein kinase